MDFTMMIANAADKRKLINELEIAIKRYKDNPSQENDNAVGMLCHFVLKKMIIEKLGYGPASEKMEAVDKIVQIIQTPPGKN